MGLRERLDEAIEKWNLLNHPFYRAWSDGTLSLSALQTYAREYGAFIEEIPLGWECIGDGETAEEEREHFLLWESFAHALGTHAGCALIPEVENLLISARARYSEKATALGALYAFEAQQPETAKTKLEGLRNFYSFPTFAEEYFIVHSGNDHEIIKLLSMMEALTEDEQTHAVTAAEDMSKALWDALSGILNAERPKP